MPSRAIRVTVVTFGVGLLAACGSGDGTSISINASGNDSEMIAGIGRNGQVAIDLPGGFSGNIKLPKLKLDADNFDMNGVKLFPGSTISGMNIEAHEGASGDGKGGVRVAFASPADPAQVRDWFLDRLSRQAGFDIKASGNALVGTTDEKQPFRLEMAPDGAGKSTGTIVIGS